LDFKGGEGRKKKGVVQFVFQKSFLLRAYDTSQKGDSLTTSANKGEKKGKPRPGNKGKGGPSPSIIFAPGEEMESAIPSQAVTKEGNFPFLLNLATCRKKKGRKGKKLSLLPLSSRKRENEEWGPFLYSQKGKKGGKKTTREGKEKEKALSFSWITRGTKIPQITFINGKGRGGKTPSPRKGKKGKRKGKIFCSFFPSHNIEKKSGGKDRYFIGKKKQGKEDDSSGARSRKGKEKDPITFLHVGTEARGVDSFVSHENRGKKGPDSCCVSPSGGGGKEGRGRSLIANSAVD